MWFQISNQQVRHLTHFLFLPYTVFLDIQIIFNIIKKVLEYTFSVLIDEYGHQMFEIWGILGSSLITDQYKNSKH